MGRPADYFLASVEEQRRLKINDARYPHFVASLLVESLYMFSTCGHAQQYDWYHQREQPGRFPRISCSNFAPFGLPISLILASMTVRSPSLSNKG